MSHKRGTLSVTVMVAHSAPPLALAIAGLFARQFVLPGSTVAAADWAARMIPMAIVGGVVSAAVWLVGIWAIVAAGGWQIRRARQSTRALLVASRLLNRWLPISLGMLSLAIAATLICMALAAGLAFHAYGDAYDPSPMRPYAVLSCLMFSGLLIADLGRALVNMRRFGKALDATPVVDIVGRAVTPDDAPRLWQTIRVVADELNASVPDRVVFGLFEGAFITATRARLWPSRKEHDGYTLHLPLLVLAHLDPAEARALIGHELAHLGHADADNVCALAREQQRLAYAHDQLAGTGTSAYLDGVIIEPARALVYRLVGGLDRVAAACQREWEFRADAAAATVAGKDLAAGQLLRLTAIMHVAEEAIASVAHREATADDGGATPFARADAWLARQAMPDVVPDDSPAAPHSRHPTLGERLAALGVVYDGALATRASRRVAPPDSALAQWLGSETELVSALDYELATLLQDDYVRWVHDQIRRAERTPYDGIYRADMRAVVWLCALTGTAAVVAALALPRWTSLDMPIFITSLLGLGVVGLILATWRGTTTSPVELELTDKQLICRSLRDPVSMAAIEQYAFKIERGRLGLHLAIIPDTPLVRTRRVTLGRAKRDPKRHVLHLYFGPLCQAGGPIDHEVAAARIEATLQGHRAHHRLQAHGIFHRSQRFEHDLSE